MNKDMNTSEAQETFEYECYLLDPNTTMSHIEGEAMLKTNELHEACSFVYNLFIKDGTEACVYQPRLDAYRDSYRKSEFSRDKKGRFTKGESK